MRPLILFAALAVSRLAAAQVCDFSLCPSGTEYRASEVPNTGTCHHCDGFPTFACSHTIESCPSGSTLDPKTGICTWNICGGGGCGGELPLCPSGTEYTGSGTSASGTYGSCKHCDGFPTFACSHTLEQCREGWTLQTATGMCRKDCLPDLRIKYAWLRDAYGSVVSAVKYGNPYYICADVQNVGAAGSASCSLGGGGLGVPVPPTTSIPALAAYSSTTRCLYYWATPPAGTWYVGLTADSTSVVRESNEANNDYLIAVSVSP